MSTKNLREAVMILASVAGTPNSKRADVARAAMAELEAIERAAHLLTVVGQSEAHVDRYEEWKAACELLRSIAKDAP